MLANRFGEAFALARGASTSRTCAADGLHGATSGPSDASAARARRTGPGASGMLAPARPSSSLVQHRRFYSSRSIRRAATYRPSAIDRLQSRPDDHGTAAVTSRRHPLLAETSRSANAAGQNLLSDEL